MGRNNKKSKGRKSGSPSQAAAPLPAVHDLGDTVVYGLNGKQAIEYAVNNIQKVVAEYKQGKRLILDTTTVIVLAGAGRFRYGTTFEIKALVVKSGTVDVIRDGDANKTVSTGGSVVNLRLGDELMFGGGKTNVSFTFVLRHITKFKPNMFGVSEHFRECVPISVFAVRNQLLTPDEEDADWTFSFMPGATYTRFYSQGVTFLRVSEEVKVVQPKSPFGLNQPPVECDDEKHFKDNALGLAGGAKRIKVVAQHHERILSFEEVADAMGVQLV
jgi:hypothetical protein